MVALSLKPEFSSMYQIIASTLFQNKICRLPGIGTLLMLAHPAATDFGNALIKSPLETIDFIAEQSEENAFNEFSAISELLKKNIAENGDFLLKGIGIFSRDNKGVIQFAPISIDPVFTPSLTAERVIRQDAEHAIVVGDQRTTNVQMTEYFSEQEPLKDKWWVWAIGLAALGIILLLVYFYRYGLNALGNIT
ncbi:MAG: hypothetical protein ABIN01_07295 [Ferruginibacter sp.]